MAKVVWKGGALVAPVPAALVTCGTMDSPNVLTIAWTGTVCTTPPMTYISVRPSRHSYHLIKESGEFVINLTPASMVRTVDSCGVYTGAKVNKMEKYGLVSVPASVVACPVIEQCPLSLECRVKQVVPLGSHDMFLAEIVAIDVDDSLIDKEGKLHLEKAGLQAYVHGEYFELGKRIGSFGFSVRKKHTQKTKERRG